MDGGQIQGSGYRNSGLARFGGATSGYTPATYTPQTFTPRTFVSGPQMQVPAQANAGAGNRFGTQPVQSGSSSSSSSSSPYSFPTGGSNSLGNGQTIYYGNGTNQGISPGLARGIGMGTGMLTGNGLLGAVFGQALSGAGASTAGNMNGRQPFSDARDGGNYTGSSSPVTGNASTGGGSGSYAGYTTGSTTNYTGGGTDSTDSTDSGTSSPSAAGRMSAQRVNTNSSGGK